LLWDYVQFAALLIISYCLLNVVQGFLKNERENALLAVIEHTRKNVRSIALGEIQ